MNLHKRQWLLVACSAPLLLIAMGWAVTKAAQPLELEGSGRLDSSLGSPSTAEVKPLPPHQKRNFPKGQSPYWDLQWKASIQPLESFLHSDGARAQRLINHLASESIEQIQNCDRKCVIPIIPWIAERLCHSRSNGLGYPHFLDSLAKYVFPKSEERGLLIPASWVNAKLTCSDLKHKSNSASTLKTDFKLVDEFEIYNSNDAGILKVKGSTTYYRFQENDLRILSYWGFGGEDVGIILFDPGSHPLKPLVHALAMSEVADDSSLSRLGRMGINIEEYFGHLSVAGIGEPMTVASPTNLKGYKLIMNPVPVDRDELDDYHQRIASSGGVGIFQDAQPFHPPMYFLLFKYGIVIAVGRL